MSIRQLLRSKPKILFAMTGAYGLDGGIACLNRNILYALVRLSDETGLDLSVLSLHESEKDRPKVLPRTATFEGYQGDKTRFSLALLSQGRGARFILFDHVRLASALYPLMLLKMKQVAVFAHGPEAWRNVGRFSMLIFQHAALCLANSDFTLRKMRGRFSGFNGVACPLGMDPQHTLFDSPPGQPEVSIPLQNLAGHERVLGAQVLLLVGRMDARQEGKGHREVLRAFAEIVREFPDAQIVFAGTGDDADAVASLARELQLSEHVFMPGYVSLEMLNLLYRQCYAFVMPSRQDGFGLVYLEAMNYAKPCVGCFDDGGECVIDHEKTGYLVKNPKDSGELAGILEELLKSPKRARQMGQNGFERLHREFSAEKFQERLNAHLYGLL